MTQEPLITTTDDAVLIATLRRNVRRILDEKATAAFCRHRPDGTSGCGREIWFLPVRGGKTWALDEEGNRHKCKEIKP